MAGRLNYLMSLRRWKTFRRVTLPKDRLELSANLVLVEFADPDGVAYVLEPIPVDKLIDLRHTPAMAAWRLAAIGPTPDIQGMPELGA